MTGRVCFWKHPSLHSMEKVVLFFFFLCLYLRYYQSSLAFEKQGHNFKYILEDRLPAISLTKALINVFHALLSPNLSQTRSERDSEFS